MGALEGIEGSQEIEMVIAVPPATATAETPLPS